MTPACLTLTTVVALGFPGVPGAAPVPAGGTHRVVAATSPTTPSPTGRPGDPLGQVVTDSEAAPDGARVEIGAGHVDLGPKVVDGRWTLRLRDDTVSPPVWRRPEDVVLRVHDAALLTLPDDAQYDFLGPGRGRRRHVVPQTQAPGVVWVGWNTQDPHAAAQMDGGAHLSIRAIDCPGGVHLFLQDGTFGRPRRLYDSDGTQNAPIWMDVNTHVHANWVFGAPGVCRMLVQVDAKNRDGNRSSATATLRFAVGDAVTRAQAEAGAPLTAPGATGASGAARTSGPAAAGEGSGAAAPPPERPADTSTVVTAAAGSAALTAAVLVGLWAARRRTRRLRAEALR